MRTETQIKEQTQEEARLLLRKRQMNPAEATYWRAPFSVFESKRGDTYWVATTRDAQGDGPIFRVTAAKKNRDRVTPEMVVRAVEGEMVMGEGRVVVTEVVDGTPTFVAAFDVERAWGARSCACVFTTNPARCALATIFPREGDASLDEVRAGSHAGWSAHYTRPSAPLRRRVGRAVSPQYIPAILAAYEGQGGER